MLKLLHSVTSSTVLLNWHSGRRCLSLPHLGFSSYCQRVLVRPRHVHRSRGRCLAADCWTRSASSSRRSGSGGFFRALNMWHLVTTWAYRCWCSCRWHQLYRRCLRSQWWTLSSLQLFMSPCSSVSRSWWFILSGDCYEEAFATSHSHTWRTFKT